MYFGLVLSFLIPFVLSLLFTPPAIRIARKIGAIDTPDQRKVHEKSIPRLGGLSIFVSILFSIGITYLLFPSFFGGLSLHLWQTRSIAICFAAIFLLGLWDDIKALNPGIKFGVQIAAAALIYFAGFKISVVTNPVSFGILNVQFISLPLTILWIVGITNAFNLIDGLDGLASGVGSIACIFIFAVSIMSGQQLVAILSLMIAGALIGFLPYNFRPARIFLGDSGSLFIGFLLSLLSLQSTAKLSTGFALLFPLLVLGLPITDTLVSMIRRFLGSFLAGQNGDKTKPLFKKIYGMFRPDSAHIHHRLLSLGLSHRNTVIILYAVSAIFGVGAFVLTKIENTEMLIVFALIGCFIFVLGIKKLRYHEIAIFNNGLLMPFYERWVMNRTSYLSLFDLGFIATAYCLSYFIIHKVNPGINLLLHFDRTLLLVLAVQLSIFWMAGTYREKIREMGLGGAMAVTRSVFFAVLATIFIIIFGTVLSLAISIQFLVLDFYFLLTFTLGFRIAYSAFVYWFNREKDSTQNILIYGVNENGSMILHKISNSSTSNVKVLGFLDDDTGIVGKYINGYPVLGSHWQIEKINRKKRIDAIYLCQDNIKSENYRRMQRTARQNGIEIKVLQIQLQDTRYQEVVDETKKVKRHVQSFTA
jgi:UDP-GlcNAc:undecaprenyl-phosphate GlcNAc-1-phosphate transferase